MTTTPAAPQPDLADLDDPIGGVYASTVASAFVAAVVEHLPGVIDRFCDRQHHLTKPGGREFDTYLAAERIWADSLRRRVFRLVQQCPPLIHAATVLYETEWFIRRELVLVVFAASSRVVEGDRNGALSTGLAEAELRGRELREALLTVMAGGSAIEQTQAE